MHYCGTLPTTCAGGQSGTIKYVISLALLESDSWPVEVAPASFQLMLHMAVAALQKGSRTSSWFADIFHGLFHGLRLRLRCVATSV